MGKQMLKISQGRVRDKNVTWFPELVDKSIIIIHTIWYLIFYVMHFFRKEHQDPLVLGYEEQRGEG